MLTCVFLHVFVSLGCVFLETMYTENARVFLEVISLKLFFEEGCAFMTQILFVLRVHCGEMYSKPTM